MSASYTWVGWNAHKKRYDAVMLAAVGGYLAAFVLIGTLAFPAPGDISPPILLIRALGSAALLLLHVTLWIGPLCRFTPRLLPLLYNRRHLGVTTFLLGLAHAALSTLWYHGFSDVNPLLSLLTSNTQYTSLSRFPFETLGIIALLILFLMAATSHDFWLRNLSPRLWKSLHMLVYVAYALLVMHVALGYLQSEHHPLPALLLVAGAVITISLHLAAGLKEVRRDHAAPAPAVGLVDVGAIDDIPADRAKVVCLPGRERIAVFRHAAGISATANVCEHQMGPLGEGKVIDGCITCPWHGYQYLPGSGCSPPPFTEKIATHEVRIQGRRVLLNPAPLPPGTPVPPAPLPEPAP
jgi:methionine sulfoxide reductase heme-binding subunit